LTEEVSDDDLTRHHAYLKGARQDPQPWEEAGPSTAPMAALTQPVLGEMDRRVAGTTQEPQRPAQRRLSRMQERARRKEIRRRFGICLGVAVLVMVAVGFYLGQQFL
jgi:hypothetical protein